MIFVPREHRGYLRIHDNNNIYGVCGHLVKVAASSETVLFCPGSLLAIMSSRLNVVLAKLSTDPFSIIRLDCF